MRYNDVIARVNKLTDDDDIVINFKALRQDALIWGGFQKFLGQPALAEMLTLQRQPLTPGTLAVLLFDRDFDFSLLNTRQASRENLEKMMFGFEDYLLSSEPINAAEDASLIALAIIEKYKNDKSWINIFQDIIFRMKLSDDDTFLAFWGTIFAIVVNLIEEKDEFIINLTKTTQPEISVGILNHCVLCMPISDADKAELLSQCSYPLNPQIQVNLLSKLKVAAGNSLTESVAEKLLKKYPLPEEEPKTTRDYWQNPFNSMQQALEIQAIADIALLSGNNSLAEGLNDQSISILAALLKKGKVKKAGVSQHETTANNITDLFSAEELTDPDVLRELVYKSEHLEISAQDMPASSQIIRQVKDVGLGENDAMARVELSERLNQLSDTEFDRILVDGPEQIHGWNPLELLQTLHNSGANHDALRLAKRILVHNPNNIMVNKIAAAAAESVLDYSSTVNSLETLAVLESDSPTIKRQLGEAYIKSNDNESAYSIYEQLAFADNIVDEADLVNFGEIALQTERPDQALKASAVLLERHSDNVMGLTLSGIANYKTGQNEIAVEQLRKAAAVSDGEPRPWIELGNILWIDGNQDAALTVYREGIAANAENTMLQKIYATKLMDSGMITEALPYLQDLSENETDANVDWLLIKAMEHLGMDGVESALSVFMVRHAEDYRFRGEYGAKLIWQGKIEDGLPLLQSIKNQLNQETGWALAYAEGLMRPDYRLLMPAEKLENHGERFTRELLNNVLLQEPENLKAKLLDAERLLEDGKFTSARDAFNEIMELSQGGQGLPAARLFTGFAQSAIRTNDQEVALAALEQAMSIEPEWYGLLRIKTEFSQITGDKATAVKLGINALELAPDCAENYIWLLGLLDDLNAKKEYYVKLSEAIEKYPNNLGLRLIESQKTLPDASDEECKEIENRILALINDTEDERDLIKAAVVFSTLGNAESTITCLEKAANQGSNKAGLYLTGLYRIRREHEKALSRLDLLNLDDSFIELLRTEIEFNHSGICNNQFLENYQKIVKPEITFEEIFLPTEWKVLIESDRPEIVLQTQMEMVHGGANTLLERVVNWVEQEPDNLEARIYGIELTLASNNNETYIQLLNHLVPENNSQMMHHFELLKIEQKLDSDAFDEDIDIVLDTTKPLNVNNPQIIAWVRILAAKGNLHDAEIQLEMVKSLFAHAEETPFVLRIGLLRNLIKSLAAVNRWGEAVQFANMGMQLAPQNTALKALQLQVHTQALEFNQRSEGLNVVLHRAEEQLLQPPLDVTEITNQFPELGGQDIQRWSLRYKLAIEPTRETIRALALEKPEGDGVAALMAGLRQIGQVNTAIQISKKFMDNPSVLFELACCHVEEEPLKAAEYLEKSILACPNQPLAFKFRSDCFARAGDNSEALRNIEEALSIWSNELQWHEEAAGLWQILGNLANTVTHLEQAVLINQESIELQQKLGDALLRTDKAPEALKHLLIAAASQPGQAPLWQSISEAHLMIGELDLAMESAEKAVQLEPHSVGARLQAGKTLLARGELENALEQGNLAISLEPNNPDNYVFMARILLNQGDRNKAMVLLEKVISLEATSLQTMVEHAKLLKEIKGVAAARDLIATYSDKYPENPDLLKLLAEAENQCGNLKQAEIVARRALEIHPAESGLQMLLGKIQAKVGNLDQAVNYFSRAIAVDPKLSEGYLQLSNVYSNQRDFVNAKKVLEQGINKAPADVELYTACAAILKEAKDYHGAEKMLRRATQIEPRNINIHRQLGAVLALNLVHQSQEVSSQL